MAFRVLWMLWNLFLAVIPVALGYLAAALGARVTRRSVPWLGMGLALVLLLWLIFLPNSCYLFTEPRHLLTAVERHELLTRARSEPEVALILGFWTTVAVVYSAAGALTFALSIRPVKAMAQRMGLATGFWAVPFYLLMSIGVYLGLVLRYNSWDLLTRPGAVLQTVVGLADRPLLTTAIVLFAVILWAAFEVMDIWVDGFALRWQRWRGRGRQPDPLDRVPVAGPH